MCNDIIKRFIELLSEEQPGLNKNISQVIEQKLRQEYAGERVYISKRGENIRLKILSKHTGKNTHKLMRELQVSKATFYRALRLKKNNPAK